MSRQWRDLAACRDSDPELFFPIGTGPLAVSQIAAAKAVCARCPVRQPCLAFALDALPQGIAGGLTPAQRRRLRSGRARRGPRGVRWFVVEALVSGEAVAAASEVELIYAAVVLRRAGHSGARIASRLGVHERRVYRWLRARGQVRSA